MNKGKGGSEPFDSVRISIASPEDILSWSHGEVTRSDTINQKTFKPEPGGLFCTRIFGPEKDYQCLCGEYQKPKSKGIICEHCKTEVTLARVRRERMAHITLASPVVHTWYLRSSPSVISSLLAQPLKNVRAVAYHERFIVTDPGTTDLPMHHLLTTEEYEQASQDYGREAFLAMSGAEAIRHMLAELDMAAESKLLRSQLDDADEDARKRMIKRLRIMDGLLQSGQLPEWMVMTVLPVIPPGLRPLVPIDGDRFTSSDLNDLYKRVINRNNRLKRLIELRSPSRVISSERSLLQKAVDALFDNSAAGQWQVRGINRRPLKSLSDTLKGKHGRFRQNMLGKRVDYSGRSVITVGPQLKLHQCGLPRKMAVELFKPFIYAELDRRGITQTLKQAGRLVEKARRLAEGGSGSARHANDVWDALDRVIRGHPVILNRAPTLHRLGIQAFEAVIVEGHALQLHPLVCTAFNADFDGDQMAVHVPLSTEAQLESKVLMLASNNILHPASGEPIITPSQDMVLGLYELSVLNPESEPKAYANHEEVMFALEYGHVGLHDRIVTRFDTVAEDGSRLRQRVETTPGRMIIGEVLPRHPSIGFELCNRKLRKGDVSAMIMAVYRECGQEETVRFCDRLLHLGFSYSTKSGCTSSIAEMKRLMPDEERQAIIDEARTEVDKAQRDFEAGLINDRDRYKKVIGIWAECGEEVKRAIMRIAEGDAEYLNSTFMQMDSKARGSLEQLTQIIGMKGLVSRSDNTVIEQAITANYAGGHSVLECFNACAGGRKGLTDTALKTASSGYMTNRLVNSARWCSIVEADCGTDMGVRLGAAMNDRTLVTPLGERIRGRTLAEDLPHPDGGILATAGTLVDEALAEAIDGLEVASARIRSPVTCQSIDGKCSACYGTDLARSTRVSLGESIGVIAAQSIGEPGTQLTLRTFHIGGQANVRIVSNAVASHNAVMRLRNTATVADSNGHLVVLSGSAVIMLEDRNGQVLAEHGIPYGARLMRNPGEPVASGEELAKWDPHSRPILAGTAGTVSFEDLVTDVSVQDVVNEDTGFTRRTVMDWQAHPQGRKLSPAVSVAGEADSSLRSLVPGAVLMVEEGDEVAPGDTVARVELKAAGNLDITGGLPQVDALFEGRKPTNPAIISAHRGRVQFGETTRSGRRLTVGGEDNEYVIPRGRHSHLQDGDHVEVGDMLLEGEPDPQDILDTGGIESFTNYMLEGVQSMYREQGVIISDRHIEVMISCMVQMREILDPGDTLFEEGETVHCSDLHEADERARQEGMRPSTAKILVMGITKASLSNRSWLAAASFQNTKRILTEASVAGRTDRLIGVKENVLVGRLIPAGTGAVMQQSLQRAETRDGELALQGAPLKSSRAQRRSVALPDRRRVDYAGSRHHVDRYSRTEEQAAA